MEEIVYCFTMLSANIAGGIVSQGINNNRMPVTSLDERVVVIIGIDNETMFCNIKFIYIKILPN